MLNSVGYDPRKTEDMYYELEDFINNRVNKNKDEVYEIMKENAEQQSNKLLDLYEEFLQEVNEVGEESLFKQGLNCGISLEDQNSYAKEIINSADSKKKDSKENKYKDLFR